ncbi:hypothetical protein ACLB2K_023267 [Fragaria x ananassa]
MDPYVYKVVRSGAVDISTMNIPVLLSQQTPKGNNVLHIAAEHKPISVFQDLRRARRLQHSMFWTTNKMGDTPLHVAARVGCDKIVKFLIEHAKARAVDEESRHRQQADDDHGEAHKILLRMINLEMDTALHVAVRYGHFGVVRLLLAADPELCGFTNCADESPLFLATRQGFLQIARLILHEGPTSPSFRGFNGITALQIVVSQTSEEAKGIFKIMVSKIPKMIEEADVHGWTPLHYAAFVGDSKATRVLMETYSAAYNADTALMKTYYVPYNVDKSGMSALHVAAYAGRTDVIDELVMSRPDLVDVLNHRGQTALHAAVAGGQVTAVKHMLMFPITGEVTIINHADKNGNTPLHMASIYGNREIINVLMRDARVDITAINKDLSTAAGIFLCNNTGEQEKLGCSVGPPLFQQLNHDYWKSKSSNSIELNRRRESRLLTATLIATVTFAAGFTVPGGTRSDGKAVLNGSMYYKTFSLVNWFSFLASAFVIYNEILEKTVLPVRLVALLIQLSIGGMVVALAAGYSALQTGFRMKACSSYS